MSILIKGMEIPVTCSYCPLIGYDPEIEWNDGGRETQGAYICVLTHELIDNTKREDHCPLVEIPPHGRLIDADALHKLFIEKGKEFKGVGGAMLAAAAWCIANAPTIIPTEEGETCILM